MSLESFLYGNLDIEEELSPASDRIISIAFKIIADYEDLNDMLEAAVKYRAAVQEALYESEGLEGDGVMYGPDAEKYFIELFVKLYKRNHPIYKEDRDIMECYTGYELNWNVMNFTKNELITIAKAVVQRDIAVHNELNRMRVR